MKVTAEQIRDEIALRVTELPDQQQDEVLLFVTMLHWKYVESPDGLSLQEGITRLEEFSLNLTDVAAESDDGPSWPVRRRVDYEDWPTTLNESTAMERSTFRDEFTSKLTALDTIRTSSQVNRTERDLLVEILKRETGEDGCTVNNEELGEAIGAAPKSVANMLSCLRKKGVVNKAVTFDGRQRKLRVVIEKI